MTDAQLAPAKAKRLYVPELEGLRGLLALWVFIYHALAISGAWSRIPPKAAEVLNGNQAVCVFIILSGFVITVLLATTRDDYPTYIARRFVRLWPTLMACLMGALVAQSLGMMPSRGEPTWLHLALHAVMLHGLPPTWLLPAAPGAILNPAWSISLEWQFYLLAPLALMGKRSVYTRFVLSAVTAVFLYRVAGPLLGKLIDGAVVLPDFAHLFAVGIASGLVFLHFQSAGDEERTQITRLTAAAGLAFALFLPFVVNVPTLSWAVVFFLVLLSRCRHRLDPGSRLLLLPAVQLLGAVSYPFYLCHEIWIWVTQSALAGQARSDLAIFAAHMIVALPVSLISAWLLHRYVEVPTIAWGKGLTRKALVANPSGRA